jgi:hypothetical protein
MTHAHHLILTIRPRRNPGKSSKTLSETACGRLETFIYGSTRSAFDASPFDCATCVKAMHSRDRKFRKASRRWFQS